MKRRCPGSPLADPRRPAGRSRPIGAAIRTDLMLGESTAIAPPPPRRGSGRQAPESLVTAVRLPLLDYLLVEAAVKSTPHRALAYARNGSWFLMVGPFAAEDDSVSDAESNPVRFLVRRDLRARLPASVIQPNAGDQPHARGQRP